MKRYALISVLVAQFCLNAAYGYGGLVYSEHAVTFQHIKAAIVVDGDTATVHLKAHVEGARDNEFVWLLPVPAKSELVPSHNHLFAILDDSTAPFYTGNLKIENDDPKCRNMVHGALYPIADKWHCFESSCPPVELVYMDEEGPTEVRWFKASADSVVAGLQGWGLNVTPLMDSMLRHYAVEGYQFLALRYSPPNIYINELYPIGIKYPLESLVLPISLYRGNTHTGDPQLTVWGLGKAGAVPANYLTFQLDQTHAHWLSAMMIFGNRTAGHAYAATNAVHTLGDTAFSVDYSKTSNGFAFSHRLQYDREALKNAPSIVEFIRGLIDQGFTNHLWGEGSEPSWQIVDLLRRYVPLPERLLEDQIPDELRKQGVTVEEYYGPEYDGQRYSRRWVEQDFYSFMGRYSSYIDPNSYDTEGFLAELDSLMVRPLTISEDQAERSSYITRLHGVIPRAPIMDPQIVFSTALDTVSQQRHADLKFKCLSDRFVMVETTFQNGRSYRYRAFDYKYPFSPYSWPVHFSEPPPPAVMPYRVTAQYDRLGNLLWRREIPWSIRTPESAAEFDYDDSGTVDLADLFILADHFGIENGSDGYNAIYDVDNDGRVSYSDLSWLMEFYGPIGDIDQGTD